LDALFAKAIGQPYRRSGQTRLDAADRQQYRQAAGRKGKRQVTISHSLFDPLDLTRGALALSPIFVR
jgi:hypothetical protein